jgi:hypothetical protein
MPTSWPTADQAALQKIDTLNHLPRWAQVAAAWAFENAGDAQTAIPNMDALRSMSTR